MTAIWRFPDQLGGGEYDDGLPAPGDRMRFVVAGVGLVEVPTSSLVEVVLPPLPDEPLLHAVVLDGRSIAHQHLTTASVGWGRAGLTTLVSWGEVCAYGAPTLLTLDPFAEKVELPWDPHHFDEAKPRQMRTRVHVDSRGVIDENAVGANVVVICHTPDGARDKARALVTAADALEAQRGGS